MLGAVLLIAGGSGCVAGGHVANQPPAALRFDPAAFFAGRTQGRGVLKIALHRRLAVLVEGTGRVTPDGTIILDQTVRNGTAPAKLRRWQLRPDGTGGWTGSLSDAAGPVHGRVDGDCLHLAFAMRGGYKAQQWLYLQPGGDRARNVLVVRKMGLTVARLDETITRLPVPAIGNTPMAP